MKVITALFLLASTSAACDTAGDPCVETLRNTGLSLEATTSQIDYMLG
jgi:membrane-bound transcription factor site-1 protease